MIRTGVAAIKQLLESGVHFGHQKKRWNPKMKKYIFQEKNGIYIIDLQKASNCLDIAYNFIFTEVADKHKTIIFVGTKKQARDCIEEEAIRCNMLFVNQRWLGGTLTNFSTIKKRIERLEELEAKKADGYFERLTKKEAASLDREIAKLKKTLGGIKQLNTLTNEYIYTNRLKFEESKENSPGNISADFIRSRIILFIVDPHKEHIAIKEARKLGIAVVGIVDTNCDPEELTYPIPANDDSIKSVKLLTSKIADAVLDANNLLKKEKDPDEIESNSSKSELKNENLVTI